MSILRLTYIVAKLITNYSLGLYKLAYLGIQCPRTVVSANVTAAVIVIGINVAYNWLF